MSVELRRVLEGAQRVAKRHEHAVLAASVVAAGALVFALAVVTQPLLGEVFSVWALRFCLLCVLAAAVVAYVRRIPSAFWISARLSHTLEPRGTRSAVRTAEDFLVSESTPESETLLRRAHIEQTTQRILAEPQGPTQRVLAHFQPTERRAKHWLVASVLLAAICSLALRRHAATLLANAATFSTTVWSEQPLAANIAFDLVYPAYTGKAPETIAAADGSMGVLKGTQVTFRARATRDSRSARLVFEPRAGQTPPPPIDLTLRGRELMGAFTADTSALYRVELGGWLGKSFRERKARSITVTNDAAPSVEIVRPATDTELKDSDQLSIEWKAGDDFAITQAELIARAGPVGGAAREHRLALPLPEQRSSQRPIQIQRTYTLELAPLSLAPGDELEISVEVTDNNTLFGPGKTRSSTRRLSIYSSSQAQRDQLARMRAVVDKLIDLLAAEIVADLAASERAQAREAAQTQKAQAAERADTGVQIAEELTQIGVALAAAASESSPFALAAQRSGAEMRELYEKKRRADAVTPTLTMQKTAIAWLEKTVVYFEDLRALSLIEELKSDAKKLRSMNEDLRSLIQQYKQTGDENLRRAIEQQTETLKQKIADLMNKMASLRQGLPPDFVNKEAFDRNKIDNIFENIDSMLSSGKLDSLTQEIESLENRLQNMEKSVGEAEEEYGGENYSQARKDMEKIYRDLDTTIAAQQDAQSRARELEQTYKKAVERANGGKKLDDAIQEIAKHMQAAKDAIERHKESAEADTAPAPDWLDSRAGAQKRDAQQAIGNAQNALSGGELQQAADSAADAASKLEYMKQVLKNAAQFSSEGSPAASGLSSQGGSSQASKERAQQGIKDADEAHAAMKRAIEQLSKLMPPPDKVLNAREKQAQKELSGRQKQIAEQAEALEQQMQKLSEQAPMFDPAQMQSMKSSAGEMRQAGDKLAEGRTGPAMGHQQSALQKLRDLKEAMSQQQQGSGGKGMPMPVPGHKPGKGTGGRHNENEKIELPNADDFKVPAEFRRDILDAMKQRVPKEHEAEVEKYYKELVR